MISFNELDLQIDPIEEARMNAQRLAQGADQMLSAASAFCVGPGKLAIDNQVPHIAEVALEVRALKLVQACPILTRPR